MKKNNYKIYLTGALVFVSVFLIFSASLARAQDEGGPPPIDSPVVTAPPAPAPITNPTPVAPTGSTTGGTTLTQAQNAATQKSLNWFSCFTSPFSCSVYGISTVINWILNLAVTFGVILMNVGLYLDGQVFTSATVQTGFSVSLAIANLGFVLGIIVIALATILRNETYGIKQMLWKLIIMAILVNFGLVICGPIVGLADNFTGYFLTASGGASNFTNNITQAFAPQKLFQQQPAVTETASEAADEAGCEKDTQLGATGFESLGCPQVVKAIANSDNTGAGDFTRAVLSLLFSAVFLGITALTFITIGLLLVVRYIYLAMLLILLPLAWLMWVFPKFSSHFTQWWSLFIKWTFFPAVSIFFIYLATLSVTIVNNNVTVGPLNGWDQSASTANINNDPLVGFMVQTGSGSLLQTALDIVLMCGLCFGGLFAANAMSIKGADTAIGGAKAVGGWATGQMKGFAGKHSARVARRAYQGIGGDRANTWMQKSRIPGVSTVGRWAGDQTKKGGADLVKKASSDLNFGDRSDEELSDQLMGAGKILGADKQLAYLKELHKRGKLHKIDKIGGKDLTTWMDDNEKLFKNYGQGKLESDINKQLGGNKAMRQAEREVNATPEPDEKGNKTPERIAAEKKLDEATDKFTENWDKGDAAQINPNIAFKKDTPMARALLKSFALQSPSFAQPAFSKANKGTQPTLKAVYLQQISAEMSKRDYFKNDSKMDADVKEEEEKLAKATRDIGETADETKKATLRDARNLLETNLKELKKKRETLKQKMTAEEKNLELAYDSVDKSILNNAIFGEAATPVPAPTAGGTK